MSGSREKRVVLGFSGGVDSTAAALVLKNQGYDLLGLYFDVLSPGDYEAKANAAKMADLLDIRFIAVNISEMFEEKVIQPFLGLYERGMTPNPCIFCNPQVKFHVLKEVADSVGAKWVATGHYARVKKGTRGNYYIYKGRCVKKDQSYMLYRLTQAMLERIKFPIGEFESKDEIRNLVRDMHLPNSDRKDSQDICFIKDGGLAGYMNERGVTGCGGNFVDTAGKVIAPHKGIASYTPGQRKGLGVALGRPVFVKSIDPAEGKVVLGSEAELYEDKVYVENLFWSGTPPKEGRRYMCKLRYSAKKAPCTAEYTDEGMLLSFEKAQRAPAPGQSAVIYDGSRLLGGGYIGFAP